MNEDDSTQRIRLAIDKALEALPPAPEDGRASTWSSDHQAAGRRNGFSRRGNSWRVVPTCDFTGVESAVVPSKRLRQAADQRRDGQAI